MNKIFTIATRAAFTFVAFLALQYILHYMLLVAAGVAAAAFLWFTNSDRNLAIGLLIGSAAFGVFAFLYGSV
jgi:hypothetical protein